MGLELQDYTFLMEMNEKLGTPRGYVKDPLAPTLIYDEGQLKKVFIS